MQSTYLNYALRQLEAIVNIPSPSGFTAEAVRYCSNEFANMGYTPEITPKGGLLVCLGGEGEGLLFYGSTILPFVDHFPKNTELYRIMTTKPLDLKKEDEQHDKERN